MTGDGAIRDQLAGMGVSMDPSNVGTLMQSPEGVAEMLEQPDPQTGIAPAQVFADVVTVQRADNRKLSELHGVDLEVERMAPSRAAQLLAGTVVGDGIEIVELFNDLEDQRDAVLREALPAGEYQQFLQQKRAALFCPVEDGGSD
jgi:hypothetical protein